MVDPADKVYGRSNRISSAAKFSPLNILQQELPANTVRDTQQQQPRDVRLQFNMPERIEPVDGGETSYDLNEDPLPDAEAVIIADLPFDPGFHGFTPEPLQQAFSELSRKINRDLGLYDDESKISDIPSTASKLQSRNFMPDCRPRSAVEIACSETKTKPRAKSAVLRKTSSSDRYLVSNQGHLNHVSDSTYSDTTSVAASSKLEPIVISCTTGKQVGGFTVDGTGRNFARVSCFWHLNSPLTLCVYALALNGPLSLDVYLPSL